MGAAHGNMFQARNQLLASSFMLACQSDWIHALQRQATWKPGHAAAAAAEIVLC